MQHDPFGRPLRHAIQASNALTGEELCSGQNFQWTCRAEQEEPNDWYAHAVLIGMSMDTYYVAE